jgi:hypothetical protein
MDDIWSDEEECNSPTLIEDISSVFNFRSFFFLEDNHLKINKRLGKISYIRNDQIYKADHSIHFPKIIHKKKIYNNIIDWISFVNKTKLV